MKFSRILAPFLWVYVWAYAVVECLFTTSVDAIVSNLTTIVKRLETHGQTQLRKAETLGADIQHVLKETTDKISTLHEKREAAFNEATKAAKVRENILKLLE